jgi:hypothetical protein
MTCDIIFIYIYPMTIVLIWVYLLFTVPAMFIDFESSLYVDYSWCRQKPQQLLKVAESAMSWGNNTNKEQPAELQN